MISKKFTWILIISIIAFLTAMIVDEYNLEHWGIQELTGISRIVAILSIIGVSFSTCIILILLNKRGDND